MSDFSGVLKILEDNGLKDVAPLGVASQSSTSRWSKPNDAQRATQENTWDFAFHTGEDEKAWWAIDFPRPQYITHLIIENRRDKRYQSRSENISVYCTDGFGEHLVYQGNAPFGALPDQLPLIIPVKENAYNQIRVENNVSGVLHFSQVRALSNDQITRRVDSGMPTFISQRSDGLGERLKAIMNAMLMAKVFHGRFYLKWPNLYSSGIAHLNSIDQASKIFSEDFLRQVNIDDKSFKAGRLLPIHSLREPYDFSIRPKEFDGIIVDTDFGKGVSKFLSSLGVDIREEYRKIFDVIEFSPSLKKVKDIADSLEIPRNTIALHLRSGDIVYGPPRGLGRYANKGFPFPLVLEYLRDKKNSGHEILVFGQDDSMLRYIKHSFGITLAKDYFQSSSATECAFFEICLMSRCMEICAGSSGFAQIASWRGNVPRFGLYSKFTREQAIYLTKQFIMDDIPEISDLQKSFACWAVLSVYGDSIARSEAEKEILIFAKKFDPENDFYKLAQACGLYSEGMEAAGELMLMDCFSTRFSQREIKDELNILRRLQYELQGQTTIPDSHTDILDQAARDGWPIAAFCMILIRRAERKFDLVEEYTRLFYAESREEHAPFRAFLEDNPTKP